MISHGVEFLNEESLKRIAAPLKETNSLSVQFFKTVLFYALHKREIIATKEKLKICYLKKNSSRLNMEKEVSKRQKNRV